MLYILERVWTELLQEGFGLVIHYVLGIGHVEQVDVHVHRCWGLEPVVVRGGARLQSQLL